MVFDRIMDHVTLLNTIPLLPSNRAYTTIGNFKLSPMIPRDANLLNITRLIFCVGNTYGRAPTKAFLHLGH